VVASLYNTVCKFINAAAVRVEARYIHANNTATYLTMSKNAKIFETPPNASIRHYTTIRYSMCNVPHDTPRLLGLLRPGRFFFVV